MVEHQEKTYSMSNQKTEYTSQNYSYTQGPPIGVLFHKSKIAKIGLVFIILAIIGLVISFTVPWYVQLGSNSQTLNHDFEDENGNLFGYSSYETYYDSFNYITGSPSMADGGFIFFFILGIILMIVGMLKVRYEKMNSWFSLSAGILGLIAFFPSLYVIIASTRLIGFNIISLLPKTSSSGYIFSSNDYISLFPVAYILFIFGLVMLILSFKIIKSGDIHLEYNQTEKQKSYPGGEQI